MKKKVSPSEGKLQENARKKLNRPDEELRESSKTTASDQEHVMIKDLFFDVISYCNIRNFLWHACLLACVYYLGIGMYRSQNRAITKHNMQRFFVPLGESDAVMKSPYLLGKHLIGKLNDTLNDRTPDEASIPMHAQVRFKLKPCPSTKGNFFNMMQNAIKHKLPHCYSDSAKALNNSKSHYMLQLLDNFTYNRTGKHCTRGPRFRVSRTTGWRNRGWNGAKRKGLNEYYVPYNISNYDSTNISEYFVSSSTLQKFKFGKKYWTIRCGNATMLLANDRNKCIWFSIPYQLEPKEASVRMEDLEAFQEYSRAVMRVDYVIISLYNLRFKSTVSVTIGINRRDKDWNSYILDSRVSYIDDSSIFADKVMYSIVFVVTFVMFLVELCCDFKQIYANFQLMKHGNTKQCNCIRALLHHYSCFKNPFNTIGLASLVGYGGCLWAYYIFYGVLRGGPNNCNILKTFVDENLAEPLSNNGDCHTMYSKHSGWGVVIGISLLTLVLTIRIFQTFRWHPGVNVFNGTLKRALKPLTDIFFASLLIATGVAFSLQLLLGYAGRREFDTYTNSITSVFRIAFGQFEYSDFLNDGGNQNFEGLGLGAVAWTINIIYWAIFLMFAVFITNILIAVVTDAYEIHADKAELVAYDVYCVLLLKQIIFMCIFQPVLIFLPNANIPKWALKMKVCSTYQACKLTYTYLNPNNDQNYLSEDECKTLGLPAITKNGKELNMTKDELQAFIASVSTTLKNSMPKSLSNRGRSLCWTGEEKLANDIWDLYKFQHKSSDKDFMPKGNFVRRVLSQELNSRQIEQNIQDVKEKIEKMEEKMDQILILLRKTNFGNN